MATFNAQLQKNFKLVMENGLPQATVETVGSVQWIRCCPLCGSSHQVIGTTPDDATYSPLCQTVPFLFKDELLAWHKLYPEIIDHKSVHLVEKAE